MEEGITGAQSDADQHTAFLGPDTEADVGPAHASVEPGIGTSHGRYVVLEVLGRGAMGRVLRAYDPVLQREVALKFVSGHSLDPNARERMLREARAMAQLTHPHVVAVYDAEASDAGVVLVMEYVPGRTLRGWSRVSARSWAEVVARFAEAGQGLAAAHAAGLLHRDFKPDNVLVADSGAAKVTDFGLAKVTATGTRSRSGDGLDGPASASLSRSILVRERLRAYESSASLSLPRAPESSGSPALSRSAGVLGASDDDAVDEVLTRVGTVMGTPRYMAPEQHRGEVLGPAADQYAFCVSLWEALLGAPPHRARTLRDLLDEKLREPPAWPAGAPAVPRVIIDALRRGLAADPAARWPSMEALLVALAHDPRRRRNRWLWGLGVCGLVVAAGGGWWSWAAGRAGQCSGAREHLLGVWDQARQDDVRAAMLGVGASFAEPVWQRTRGELDRYADAWAAMHGEACEATTVRGEQSAAVMDLRMACLHRARLGLGAVVRVLASADAEVTRNATDVVGSLPALERCADVEALQGDVEPPPAGEADAVEAILAEVAAATAEVEAGRYAEALATMEDAEQRLVGVEYGPVRTEVWLQAGVVLEQLGRYEASEAVLRRALESAARWQQWELLGDTAQELMFVVGYEQRRIEGGRQLWELTAGLAAGDPEREAGARNVYANVLAAAGELPEAEAEYRRALELREGVLGPDSVDVAVARSNLGLVLHARGHYVEAEAELRPALAVLEQALGAQHPTAAIFRNNLANALSAQGRNDEAEAELRAAWAVMREALGPDHPDVALSMGNLAHVLLARGELPEAEALQREALALRQRVLEPGHPDIGHSHNNLAQLLHAQGRFAEAEAEVRRALPLLEAKLGPDHADVAQLRSNLGLMLYAQGKNEAAEAEMRRALALWEAALGPRHASVGLALNNLALVFYATGRYEESEAAYRRALVVQEEALGPDHPNVLTGRGNLAQVLIARGDRAGAEAEHRRTLAVQQRVLGADHPDVARTHNNLGGLLLDRGAYAEAEQELQQALAGWERALGADHPNVATARHNLAKLMLAVGRNDEALALAEQAWSRRERDDTLPELRAATAFALARALWRTSKKAAARARAERLATQAEEGYVQAGKPAEAEAVRGWLERPDTWVQPKRAASGTDEPAR